MMKEKIHITEHAIARREARGDSRRANIIEEILEGKEIPKELARVLLGRLGEEKKFKGLCDKFIATPSKDGMYILSKTDSYWAVVTYIHMPDPLRQKFLGKKPPKKKKKKKKEKVKEEKDTFNFSLLLKMATTLDKAELLAWVTNIHESTDIFKTCNDKGKLSWTLEYPGYEGVIIEVSSTGSTQIRYNLRFSRSMDKELIKALTVPKRRNAKRG